jgi:site-specific DNA recombinase
VQRWTLPDGWIISAQPAHTPLVSEQDFVAAQGIHAQRDSATAAGHRYQLAGLLRCGNCGCRLESCWANSRPAYRCRHGHTSATPRDPSRPKNLYVRQDLILPCLPALYNALARVELAAGRRRRRTRGGIDVAPAVSEADMISYFRSRHITLTYDPVARILQTETPDATATVTGRAS